MADTRPAGRIKVQHLRAGRDEDLVNAAQHTRSQVAPEWIPHPALDFRASSPPISIEMRFSPYRLARDEIFGRVYTLPLAMNAVVLVWLDDHLRAALGPAVFHAFAATTRTATFHKSTLAL